MNMKIGDCIVCSCSGCLYWVEIVEIDSYAIRGHYITLHYDGDFSKKTSGIGCFPFVYMNGILTYPRRDNVYDDKL